nr:MFS transporter [Kibdelosporangium sp. MJ126-NF4]CEL19959.1 transporter, putative [Kibdelosporangium sp. MJ126-NF4]CTQ97183.1 transporter, putative [Kibdelosporangium sp. MJ126-NF4]
MPGFEVLRVRNYRLWWSHLSVANIGNWAQRVAQDWVALELTGQSGTALGIVTAAQFLPFLLLAPVGGVIADRFDARKVLFVTQAIIGGCAALMAVLTGTGVVAFWHVVVIAFLLGCANAVFQPTIQSFVTDLVGPDLVSSAVGLSAASFNGARVIGPAIAGVMIASWTTWSVFTVTALSVLVPMWALVRLDPSQLYPSPKDRGRGLLKEGIRYAVRDRKVLRILGIAFFVGTFALNSQLTTALMATKEFGLGAGELGVLSSVLAFGSLVGAVFSAKRKVTTDKLVGYAAVVFCTVEIICGLMPGYVTFAVSLAVLGFTQLIFMTAANSRLQLVSDPAKRGRMMALYTLLLMGGTPLGAPLMGWFAEEFGAPWSLIGGGALALAGTVAVLVALRGAVREDEPAPQPEPANIKAAAEPAA